MLARLLSYGAARAMGRALNWMLLAGLPFLLPAEEYGVVGLLIAVEAVLMGVLMVGQDRAIVRYYGAATDPPSLFRTSLTLWLLAAGPLLLLVGLAAFLGSEAWIGVPAWPHIVLLCIAVLLRQKQELYLCVIRVEGRVRQFFTWEMVFYSIKVGLIACLAGLVGTSVVYPIGFLLAVMLVSGGQSAGLVRRAASGAYDPGVSRRLIAFGWPFVFHTFGGALLVFGDRFLINYFMGPTAVGGYTLAYMIGSSIVILYGVVAWGFEPVFFKSADDPDGSELLLGYFTVALLGVGALASLAILGFLKLLMFWDLSSTYATAMTVVPILLVAHMMHPLYMASQYRLAMREQTWVLLIGSLLAAVGNVVGNILFIPRFGLAGAAGATLLSFLLLSTIQMTLSLRFWHIGWRNLRGRGVYVIAVMGTLITASTGLSMTSVVSLAAVVIAALWWLRHPLVQYAAQRRAVGATPVIIATEDD